MIWSDLTHAYGSAADLPGLFDALVPDAGAEVWGELWSRICHQETVYSASFPSLRVLHQCASTWGSGERAMPLVLAGAIIASRDAPENREALLEPFAQLLPSFLEMTLDELRVPTSTRADVISLLEAALAFKGDRVWSHCVSFLDAGEANIECGRCGNEVCLSLADYGFFVVPSGWLPETDYPKRAFLPGVAPLRAPGQWLLEAAESSAHPELQVWLPYLFGKASCLECNAELEADRIEAAESFEC